MSDAGISSFVGKTALVTGAGKGKFTVSYVSGLLKGHCAISIKLHTLHLS